MSLDEIQKQTDEWTGQFTPQYWSAYQIYARLGEEFGEVGRELNHLYGVKKKKVDEKPSSLGQELSDLMFTITCLANSHNINLQEEWDRMMKDKHYGRDNTRFEKKV